MIKISGFLININLSGNQSFLENDIAYQKVIHPEFAHTLIMPYV